MRELFMQAVTILFARSFIRVAQLVSFLILARYLSPEGLGSFGVFTTALALATQLGSVGLRQSSAYAIGQGDLTSGEASATMLVAWPFLAFITSFAVWYFYADALIGFSPSVKVVMTFVGVSAALLIMMNQGIFLGRGDIKMFGFTETAPRVLLTGFVVVLVFANSVTLTTAIWAYICSFVFVVPISLYFIMRQAEQMKPALDKLPAMVVYGVSFSMNLFLIALNTRIGMFMLDHSAGQAEAGRFFAALRINEIFIEAAVAFGLVIFSSTVRSDDQSDALIRNARIACWIFWCFSVLGLLVIIVVPLTFGPFLGKEYADAAFTLQIMAFGLGPAAATKIIYPTIAGLGRPLFGTVSIFVSLAINALVAWQLANIYGAAGVAAGMVIGQFCLFLGYAFACHFAYATPLKFFLLPQKRDVLAIAHLVKARAVRKN